MGWKDAPVVESGASWISAPEVGQPQPQMESDPQLDMGNTAANQRRISVSQNSGRSLLASIPDMFLNAPSNVMNLSRAISGTAATALGHPEYAKDVTPPPNYVRSLAKQLGFIKEENEPQNEDERYLDAAIQTGLGGLLGGPKSALMGAASGLVGQKATEATGDPNWGTAANLATNVAAGKAGDAVGNAARKRLERASITRSQNQELLDTTQKLRDAGYKIPADVTNPSMGNYIRGSMGGKTASDFDVSRTNTVVTAKLMRDDFGIPERSPINQATINELKKEASRPYEEFGALPGMPAKQVMKRTPSGFTSVSQTPDTPAQLLAEWKKTGDNIRALDRALSNNADALHRTQMLEALDAARVKQRVIEKQMDLSAKNAGRPELAQALKDAKPKLARINDLDRATNTETGEVSARDLATAKNKGVPLSGSLDTAATMGMRYPKEVRDPATIGAPTSNLNSMVGGSAGAAMGHAALGPVGWVPGMLAGASGLMGAQRGMRNYLLSDRYIKKYGVPDYGATRITKALAELPETDPGQALLRAYIQSQQRNQP